MEEIVYFEINNWFAGRDYPNDEIFYKWIKDCPKLLTGQLPTNKFVGLS